MASVVIAGRKPLYELKAADLVVKHVSELRVVNLKQLFRNEDLVAANVCSLALSCPFGTLLFILCLCRYEQCHASLSVG